MSRIGAGLLLHGEVLTVDEVLARVEALTLEEVHGAAAELIAAPRTLSVVGPFDDSAFDAAVFSWADTRSRGRTVGGRSRSLPAGPGGPGAPGGG